MRLFLGCLMITACCFVAAACTRSGSGATGPTRTVPDAAISPRVPDSAGLIDTPAGPVAPQRPRLDREPALGVLLAQGSSVTFRLLRGTTVDNQIINAGTVTATATSNGIRLDRLPGRVLGDHVLFQVDGAGFNAQAVSPDGSETPLFLSGSPEVHLDPASRKVQLVERIGLERYLPGVLAKEMSPTWPVEALKAQAIVARSYTADRFLQNWQRPWQVHWHSSVDMAYAGSAADYGRASEAVRATAGALLLYRDLPVPALFHACSGGRTARVRDLKPGLTLADGVSDPSPAMAPVDDPAAREGAQGLNLSKTHWQWTATIALTEVTADLRRWFQARSQQAIGEVTGLRVADRDADGNRVVQVVVTHRQGGKSATLTMTGNEVRLAIGPGQIRSAWWTSCEVKRGSLVISGRGYGHGVGLSQVSAWHLARSGVAADDIARHFYPGAVLERKY